MARLPQLMEVAEKFDLKLVSIEDLVAYRMQHDSLMLKSEDTEIKPALGSFALEPFNKPLMIKCISHLTKGSWAQDEAVLDPYQFLSN